MRARAQKKKKAPGEAAETPPPRAAAAPSAHTSADESPQLSHADELSQSRAVESSQSRAVESPPPAAAESAGKESSRRVIPDPQGPPVVAPVLMPAVVLSDREGVAAEAVAAVEAAGVGAMAPVAEAIMSATAQPSAQQGGAQSSGERGDAHASHEWSDPRATVVSAPRGEVDAGADGDEAWRTSDEARLLVQSPRRLFLYWRFARDPRELLREALGPVVAERLGPAVRLVDEATGEEGAPVPAGGGDYWFDVLPGRLLRAEVGFHGEGLPFVRLISSNTVETPAGGVSRVADAAPEFRVAEDEFERVLEATGFAAGAWQAERADDTARPFDPGSFDPARDDEPLRARASSDTARRGTSPPDGSHFSSPRGGAHFSNTRGDGSSGGGEPNARGDEPRTRGEVF